MMFFRRVPQVVEYASRFNACDFFLRVQLENAIEILGHIHDYGNITALPCETGAPAPGKHRRAVPAAGGNGCNDIIDGFWNDHTDRNLTIIRAVGCIQGAAAIVKTHFAPNLAF